jgi:hypothetical protein
MPVCTQSSEKETRKIGARRAVVLTCVAVGLGMVIGLAFLRGFSVSAFGHGIRVGIIHRDGYLSLAGEPVAGEGFSQFDVSANGVKRHRRALRFESQTLVVDTW